MTITVLDYSTGEVTIINNIPDTFDSIEYYLNKRFNMSDCYYMVSDEINIKIKNYAEFEENK